MSKNTKQTVSTTEGSTKSESVKGKHTAKTSKLSKEETQLLDMLTKSPELVKKVFGILNSGNVSDPAQSKEPEIAPDSNLEDISWDMVNSIGKMSLKDESAWKNDQTDRIDVTRFGFIHREATGYMQDGQFHVRYPEYTQAIMMADVHKKTVILQTGSASVLNHMKAVLDDAKGKSNYPVDNGKWYNVSTSLKIKRIKNKQKGYTYKVIPAQ